MIPWNITIAEALAYDWKPRKNTWLTNPTWRARLVPLTLHKDLIKKVSGTLPPKAIDKVNALGDNLLIH